MKFEIGQKVLIQIHNERPFHWRGKQHYLSGRHAIILEHYNDKHRLKMTIDKEIVSLWINEQYLIHIDHGCIFNNG